MRTTIDLPEDLHRIAQSIARDTSRTLSDTIADLVRRGLVRDASDKVSRHPRSGFPQVHIDRVITSDDVRELEDDE